MRRVRRSPGEKVLALVVTSHLSVNSLVKPTLGLFRDAGWRIVIICSPGPIDAEIREFATVKFVPMERSVSPGRDGLASMRMARLLRRIRPGVLVGGTPKAALISMTAGRLARVPVRIFQVRGARWDGLDGRLRSVLLAADQVTAFNATNVIAVSPSLADVMVSNGACRDRPDVLGSGGSKGVDTALFRPSMDREYGPTKPCLGFVGRLSSDKGVEDALHIFDAVRKSAPSARMAVIGELDESQPVSTSTTDRLLNDRAITWERKLPPSEVANRMRDMDLLIFPSIREGLPNAVIEAAACGVPTVGWDTTGVRDAVVHGETGYLVRLGDLDALADATARALAPEEHRRLQEGAVKLARESFASENVQAAFADYLERLWIGSQG